MKTDEEIHASAVAAGEPTFTLVAHDALAPDIIRQWVRMASRIGVGDAKTQAAERVAVAMVEWQKANPSKTRFPD